MKICDFTLPDLERFRQLCNFTYDENQIFDSLSVGNTIEETAEICNVSVSTVKRIKNRIWTKIDRIMSL